MSNVKHVNSMGSLVHLKDDAMRFEDELPNFLFKVFAFPCIFATIGELLQILNLSVELPEPTLAVVG